MADQPTGTVTLVFTDIEGSTRLLQELGRDRYMESLELHHRLLRAAFERHGGYEVDEEGDAFFVAFRRAQDAVAAVTDAQIALGTARWPADRVLRVRMGVHTGEPVAKPPKYLGLDVHRAARIAAAAHGGQVLLSDTTRALVEGHDTRDLGKHRLKDLLEPIGLHQLVGDGLPTEFPPLRTLNQTNLPVAAWPLLGREREMSAIRSHVEAGARVVTLTGPGGSGKTRLALQAAAELVDDFPGGVFFVPLAPLRDAGSVRAAIAESLGLRADDDLGARLTQGRTLLVLDNAEHLAGVDAVVSELAVGEVTVVVTSRVVLHLLAEVDVPVDPLPEAAAVELFVGRAAAAGRQIDPDADVAAVCRRVDNLPLAVELAAARAKILAPSALLQRLDSTLSLADRAHDRPERQRTLRATIDWSHALLEPRERDAFRRLSVFRGSFSLDAAEGAIGVSIDDLEMLVDSSLLKPVGDDRFLMLDTLREFARERLEDASETEEYGLRHAEYYLARLEEIDPVLRGPRTAEFLEWFGEEQDNLRAMLDRLAQSAPDRAGRGAVLLSSYWTARGAPTEGRARLEALLPLDLSDRIRAEVLQRLGDIVYRLGDMDAAENATRSAIPLAEAVGATKVLASAYMDLAWIVRDRGRTSEAVEHARRGVAEAVAAGHEHTTIRIQQALGNILKGAGMYEEAREALERGVASFRALGDDSNVAIALVNLADLDFLEGDYEIACARYSAAADISAGTGHVLARIAALYGAAASQLGLGRPHEAVAGYLDALGAAADAHVVPDLAVAIVGIALAAGPAGQADAARLCGAGHELRRAHGLQIQPHDEDFERLHEDPIRAALGNDAFEREARIGAALPLDEVIELARTLASRAVSS